MDFFSDDDIIKGIRNKRRDVLKYVYNQHLDNIKWWLVYKKGFAEEEAKDIFQDAMVATYNNIMKEDFSLKNSFRAYLFSVVNNMQILRKMLDSKTLPRNSSFFEEIADVNTEFHVKSIFAKEDKGQGGREPYNYLMMFKILILQRYYNLSDDQTEYQILDRLSFMRFLDLELSDKVPDSKTIWLFKETIAKSGKTEELFNTFEVLLESKGYIGKEGKIVDASFVEVPRQRNSREENKQIKEGKVPEEWHDNPHKLSQKDIDARWTKKNNETFYGYKNHVKGDQKSKLIEKYKVTDASVHDSTPAPDIMDEKDAEQDMYGDSAYKGPTVEAAIIKNKMKNCIHEKGYRNKPLTHIAALSSKNRQISVNNPCFY